MAAPTVTITSILGLRYAVLISSRHKDHVSIYQINMWFTVAVSAATHTSFHNKEFHKFIPIRMMLHCIQYRSQQGTCILFERIVHLLHLVAMPRTKPVNQVHQVLVVKHLFRHL